MDFGSKVPPRGLRACTWKWAYIYPGPPRFHQSGRTMRWRHVGMYAYAQNLNSRRTNAKHELIISFAHPPNRTVLFGPSRKSCVFVVNLVWIENSLAVLPVVTCLCCEQCPYDSTSHPYKIVLTLIEAEYYCLCNLFHWETKYFELRMLCVVTVIGLVFGLFVEKVTRFPCQVWLAKGTLQGKEEVSRHLKWTLNLVLRS